MEWKANRGNPTVRRFMLGADGAARTAPQAHRIGPCASLDREPDPEILEQFVLTNTMDLWFCPQLAASNGSPWNLAEGACASRSL
jgi:hypothetical protein